MCTVPRIPALHLGYLSEQLSQQIISAQGRNSVCIASALHLLQIIEAFSLSFSDLCLIFRFTSAARRAWLHQLQPRAARLFNDIQLQPNAAQRKTNTNLLT